MVVVLVVLWILGILSGVGGELINLLVVGAIIVAGYRLYQGKNVVTGK